MAKTVPTRTERDANLDSLKSAVDEWSKTEMGRLENEVKFMRSVLQGRAASDAGTKNLAAVAELVQVEIDEFVNFSS
jgi:hypothetical protein